MNYHILIPIIDALKKKNMYQLCGLHARGYRFTIVTTDSTGCSEALVAGLDRVKIHRYSSRLAFLRLFVRILYSERFSLAELYPDSYLHLLVGLILKIARIPILIVARGAELKYVNRIMSLPRRVAFRLTYALADAVLYKEPYMRDMLNEMKKKHVYFLPNSIALPHPVDVGRPQGCRFLFLNRITRDRHPEIILAAFMRLYRELNMTEHPGVRLDIIGLMGETATNDAARKEQKLREMLAGHDLPVSLHPWTDRPEEWLDQADVFLLPADVVFLNYALLEAMGRGIPPLVAHVRGSECIVTHGVNGYLLPLNEDEWMRYMKTLCLDPALRASLGQAARETVSREHSLDAYLNAYDKLYHTVISIKRPLAASCYR